MPSLQYLNARYYDPKLSLFTSPDWFEVTIPGVGTNRYAYAGNSPLNLSDPSGNVMYQDGATGIQTQHDPTSHFSRSQMAGGPESARTAISFSSGDPNYNSLTGYTSPYSGVSVATRSYPRSFPIKDFIELFNPIPLLSKVGNTILSIINVNNEAKAPGLTDATSASCSV